ncbi:MAG: DinB family protein [Armatimonadetes bacterium]|nr:DinB family protein [Armatimonadota bacterium]
MSDFAQSWKLSRSRFLAALEGMSQEQLNWRIHEGTLTMAEMAMHVAGVEVSFASQLTERELSTEEARIKAAATDGVVNDKPFPFTSSEMTPEFVAASLAAAAAIAGPVIEAADPKVRTKEIVSALGPVITGDGAFARLGFHAGYHQGQAHFIQTAPGFPK